MIEVLTDAASNGYKDFLRRNGISYIVAGEHLSDGVVWLRYTPRVTGREQGSFGIASRPLCHATAMRRRHLSTSAWRSAANSASDLVHRHADHGDPQTTVTGVRRADT